MANLFDLFKSKDTSSDDSPSDISWPDLQNQLSPLLRRAWHPVTEPANSDIAASRFGGRPALLSEEQHPCCPQCQKPLQLFLQLNSTSLPTEAGQPFGEGLLQVFYCTSSEPLCEVECEAYFPFATSTLLRIIDPQQNLRLDQNTPLIGGFPERAIQSWTPVDDYPNWEELEEHGITLDDQAAELLFEKGHPRPNDKLLHWVQGVEYPSCPDCSEPMQLLFQIDSEDNLPYMFGDCGCAHITQCPEHKARLAIAWACC